MDEIELKIRKVRLPIKLKLIFLIAVLLISAVSFYVYFALNLFEKDKSAYIYENGLSHTESISDQISNRIGSAYSQVKILEQLYLRDNRRELVKNVFDATSDIIEFSIYQSVENHSGEQVFGLRDEIILKSNDLSSRFFSNLEKVSPLPFKKCFEEGTVFRAVMSDERLPHILIMSYLKEKKIFSVGRFRVSDFLAILGRNKAYNSYIIDASGEVIFSSGMVAKLSKQSRLQILSAKQSNGVREVVLNGEEFLLSFSETRKMNLMVVYEISKGRAFLAARSLMNKSLYFGLFILSIVIIAAILFSRSLTSPIEKLFQGTVKMAEGDFETEISLKGRDEIGSLSDSFNFMIRKIRHYMEEMKEKVRLENELAVANLVQNSFFPESDLKVNQLNLAAYYRPASECGGDWWGVLEHGRKTVVLVGDATGHGVPAALITATAHCSAHSLKEFSKVNPQILDSPATILDYMNKAVCASGDQILMTFFVAVIDHDSNQLIYSNASHNPPLLCRKVDGIYTKNSLTPLISDSSPHLGKDYNSEYHDDRVEIEADDVIIFFTDGIVEGSDPEGKQWGNRKFLKSIVDNLEFDVSTIRDNVMTEAMCFYNTQPPDDDITFVVTRLD